MDEYARHTAKPRRPRRIAITKQSARSGLGDVPRPRPTRTPADRLARHRGNDAHLRRALRNPLGEASAVATCQPPEREAAAASAKGHAPAVAGVALALEKPGEVC